MKNAKVVFLVNGAPHSAMDMRAGSFSERLRDEFEIHTAYRSAHKVSAIFSFLGFLIRVRPALCYVLDVGIFWACWRRLRIAGSPTCRGVIVDTGDAIYELSRTMGSRRPTGIWLTKQLEELGLAISDRVVVRSHAHAGIIEPPARFRGGGHSGLVWTWLKFRAAGGSRSSA